MTNNNCVQLVDFMEAGLLTEQWAWVDELLAQRYYSYALTADNVDEYAAINLIERPVLKRCQAMSDQIPIDIEQQDASLLARKQEWFRAVGPFIQEELAINLGQKRSREFDFLEFDGQPFIKRPRKSGNNNIYNYVSVVSEDDVSDDEVSEMDDSVYADSSDEDSLCAALEEVAIVSDDEENIFQFADEEDMELEQFSVDEDAMEIDSQEWF